MSKFDEFFSENPSEKMDQAIFKRAEETLVEKRREYKRNLVKSFFEKISMPAVASGLAVFGYLIVRNQSLVPGVDKTPMDYAFNNDLFESMIENLNAEVGIAPVENGDSNVNEILLSDAELELLDEYEDLEKLSTEEIENS